MFTIEEGMFGITFGKWMVGVDWGMGWKRIYLFVFDWDSDDDVWNFFLLGK